MLEITDQGYRRLHGVREDILNDVRVLQEELQERAELKQMYAFRHDRIKKIEDRILNHELLDVLKDFIDFQNEIYEVIQDEIFIKETKC